MKLLNAVSASEAKAKFYELLTQASQGKIIHVIRHSRPEAVILSIEKYNELLERLEDLGDSLDLLKAKTESEDTVPLEEAKKELK